MQVNSAILGTTVVLLNIETPIGNKTELLDRPLDATEAAGISNAVRMSNSDSSVSTSQDNQQNPQKKQQQNSQQQQQQTPLTKPNTSEVFNFRA